MRKANAILLAALAALGLAISAGCSPESAHSTPMRRSFDAWDWRLYPPAREMRLATLPCQVLAKSSISIHSPLVGILKVYVAQPQTQLKAGAIWAEFDPALFRAESNNLAEAKAKLDQREQMELQLDLPEHQLKLQKEIDEAKRQVALLTLLSTNKEYSQAAFDLGNSQLQLRPEALAKAKLELSLLEKNFSYLQETNLLALGVDLPGQRADWEQRYLDFKRRLAQAQLTMPFTGQLTVSLPLSDGVQDYPVNLGQELAVARDLSQIRLRVPLSNPDWASIPTDHLTAIIRLPSGLALQARFLFRKIEQVQFREESVFYFQFSKERSTQAARLIGTDLSCELWLGLPALARIVPKYNLVLREPGAFQGREWNEGLQAAWPGAKLVIEGQTALAVRLPRDPIR